ncbi:transposase [Nonomuraea dietziae]|uniref:RNA-guided endonuclease InsQ/TnpB family protein n=1 Tax=Nonomuraea dietziae TaxID=65515 RepID=UPI0031E384EC
MRWKFAGRERCPQPPHRSPSSWTRPGATSPPDRRRQPDAARTRKPRTGVDLGLTHYAILSGGDKIANPRWLRRREKKLAKLQRALSGKEKGSKNRDKARAKVARQHVKVADARHDFLHQVSTSIIRENQAVHVETLSVRGLARGLSRQVGERRELGRLPRTLGGQGRPVRADPGEGRPLLPLLPAVSLLRVEGRGGFPWGCGVGLLVLW